MNTRFLCHVTRFFGQLSTRSFATQSSAPPPQAQPQNNKAIRGDQLVPISLRYLDVREAKYLDRTRDIPLPAKAEPQRLLKCRYGRERYHVGVNDRWLWTANFDDPILSRTLERLEHYNVKKRLEPLWVDVVTHESVTPFVRQSAKHRLRRALRQVLLARGIHHHGWDLRAYEKYWAAQDPRERANPELHGNPDWVYEIPAVFQGTLVMRISGNLKLALADAQYLRTACEAAVNAVQAQHRDGPRKRERPVDKGPRPWLMRVDGP